MTETAKLGLPLVQAAQAQKHVTVNEALARVDAMTQLRLVTVMRPTPPVAPADGDCHAVPAGATGDWAGEDGRVAVASAGLWSFVTPQMGWRAWDVAGQAALTHDGVDWRRDEAAVSAGGAATLLRVVEVDHVIGAGEAVSTVAGIIPGPSQVVGVTGRVISPISGAGLTGWRLGVSGSDNRYGSSLGLGLNSYALGFTGQPITYWSATDLILTPEGGASFDGGTVRLAVHLTELLPPAAV
ncbi:DUF2793 domain-containing protein [Pontivivens ytuae]|uniref:DUF2793 domain-containing protein n=1 Tax=Pontivivens ytuae TaxID=2789856 RepID=A0A7S9LS86_9RHOB|nr:DUF2793 domain-containing protein [Pontivivens ytuae]QPH53775.1 DUF2793 domain-containing protein [Pontivivens ytuae]